MTRHYQTEEEIEAVVRGFEGCTTEKGAFTHLDHLTVAVWYLRHFNEVEALNQMRTGLLRFLAHHDVPQGKYKEGLTVSWMNLTRKTLAELPSSWSLVDATNVLLERLGKSDLVAEVIEGSEALVF